MAEIDKNTDMKFEDGQFNLTPDQEAQVQAEALAEIRGDKKKEEKKEEDHGTEREASREEGGAPEVKEEEVKKEEEPKDEEKKVEEKKESAPDEARKKYIEDYAKSQNLTIELATEEVAKNEAVIEKFGKDPVKLAAELRKHQSELGKAKAEAEKVKKAQAEPQIQNYASAKAFVDHQIKLGGDKLIAAYRQEYPGLTETLTDEACVDMMRKEATEKVMARVEEQRLNSTSAARNKRADILSKVSDADKPYLAEFKGVLDKVDDRQLLADDFDATDILHWAKGKNIDKLIKEAEERGYKRGKEEPKIIAEKTPGKTATPAKKEGGSSSYASLLTAFEKDQALGKFDGQPMSDEEKYKAYHEIYKAKKK